MDLGQHTLFNDPPYLYFDKTVSLFSFRLRVFCCSLSCVACPLPGHHVRVEFVWLGHHLAMSSPGSKCFTSILYNSIVSVHDFCKLCFCCSFLYIRHIYCMSVHPGRGIPPPWLFLWFFLIRIKGLRTISLTVQTVKPTEAM